ncbi:hypothetical protein BN949_05511 [Agrobacterium tumefaciens]|nr:hypothetical protein BN949_05511 [Agrobacterium tumefaciens]
MPTATLQPVVENNAGSLATFAGACSVAKKPTAAKTNGLLCVGCDRPEIVKGGIDTPVPGEIAGMGFAGIDDAFELGVGKIAADDDALRQMWTIAWLWWCHRGHRERLDQRVRMRFCVRDVDRLEPVGFVDAVSSARLILRLDVPQLVGEFNDLVIYGYRTDDCRGWCLFADCGAMRGYGDRCWAHRARALDIVGERTDGTRYERR